ASVSTLSLHSATTISAPSCLLPTIPGPPKSTLFPYTTLFRSRENHHSGRGPQRQYHLVRTGSRLCQIVRPQGEKGIKLTISRFCYRIKVVESLVVSYQALREMNKVSEKNKEWNL